MVRDRTTTGLEEILETERVDNLQRPIHTLGTDEVEGRVEEAGMMPDLGYGSPPPQGTNIESFGLPVNSPSPDESSKQDNNNENDNDIARQ